MTYGRWWMWVTAMAGMVFGSTWGCGSGMSGGSQAAASGAGGAGGTGSAGTTGSSSSSAASSGTTTSSSSTTTTTTSSSGSGGGGVGLPPIVFQCTGLNGGICTMTVDGTMRKTLFASGRAPDMNAAGEILFHDDAYTVQKRLADATMQPLGAGAFPKWTPDGRIVFQCTGLNGGICTMNADGTGRKTLLASGRAPDMNAAGEILFHDDAYTVQTFVPNQMPLSLGAGAFPRWTPDGRIVLQCAGLGGGICTMNADGTMRKTLLASGRAPDMNAAGEILFHDDAYTVQKLLPNQMPQSLGAGAFPSWTP